MKTTTSFALMLLFALFPLAWAQPASEEEAVVEAERELCAVYLKGDATAIEQNVMEDYTLTNSTGKITTRAEDIDEAKKGDPKYYVFENHGMKARIHGDTAVVTGRTIVKGTSGGKPFDAVFQFTDTLVKDDGRWRLLAGHVSKISTEPH